MKTMKQAPATVIMLAATLAVGSFGHRANAQEIIKIGYSVPLSGAAAIWGKGAAWMCEKAAGEIKAGGGVKIGGKTYNFECPAYDNKYTASEATKVAQILLNKDGVKYIFALGTAPILATQSLSERQDALLLSTSWGKNSKGPKFPLTFAVINSPVEIMPAMIKYIIETYPKAKTLVVLNTTDATGKEMEETALPMWKESGITILSSDHYERGTTEFQPIAQRLMSFNADMVDLSTVPPSDAGMVFKELDLLGYKGIKISDNGTEAEGFVKTGGKAANGVYMGAAVTLDGPSATERQRKLNEEAQAAVGGPLNIISIGSYDAVYMLKAGMEKAQSIDPKLVAAVLPKTTFKSFYGGMIGLGGKASYGSDMAPQLPVYITQIVDGKVAERLRVEMGKK